MLMYLNKSKNKKSLLIFSIFIGVILNGLFNLLSTWLSLPFFLDSIFTIMITALFGLLPGLIVGLLTNFFIELLRGFPGVIYPFAIVNMLTALTTWVFVKYDKFHTPAGALWAIISMSLVNAFFGAVIVLIFFGGITHEYVDSIVRSVIATGQSLTSSAFLGRILINIGDKGIAVLVVFPIYRYFYNKNKG